MVRFPNPNFHHGSKSAVGFALDVDVFNFKANFEIICVIPQRLPYPNFHHRSKSAVRLALDVDLFNFKANFEIICVIPQPDLQFVVFEINSSTTNSWRDVMDVCPELQDGNLIGNSLYSKGYIYWMVDEFGIMKLPAGCTPSCAVSEHHGELCSLEPWVDGSGHHYVRIYGVMEIRLKAAVRLHISHMKGEKESFHALGLGQ